MSQEIVTIRPKTDSKKFRTVNGNINQIHRIQEGDKEVDKNMGSFRGERFPNSRQMFRPAWSQSKRMWKLEGFLKMTQEKQEELNKLAKSCKLRYAKTSPNAGKYIDTADVYDPADPFFSHKDLKVISSEGEVMLNKAAPIDKIVYLGVKVNSQFATGGEKLNPLMSSKVRYIIVDKTIDTEMKKDIRTSRTKAIKLLDKLTDAKRLKVALAMGAISNPDVSRDLIDEVLDEWAMDSKTKVSNKMSKQKFFIHMCETGTEELEIRTLVSKAKSAGVLKKNRNTGFMLFGNLVGKNEAQLMDYLLDEKNQEIILRIESAIDDKSN